MKPVFGVDITENKRNNRIDGEGFVIATASAYRSKALEESVEDVAKIEAKSDVPGWLSIIANICGGLSVIIIGAIIKNGWDTAVRNALWMVIAAPAMLLFYILITVYRSARRKKVMSSEEAAEAGEQAEKDMNAIYKELGVPEDAKNADVFFFYYKMKNGIPVAVDRVFQLAEYVNVDMKVFVKGDDLCICDLENLYSFKLSELKAIKKHKKRASMLTWTKEERYDEGVYEQYELFANKFGSVFFKYCYILELEHGGETYGIYFPCYEYGVFRSLTGLSAEE